MTATLEPAAAGGALPGSEACASRQQADQGRAGPGPGGPPRAQLEDALRRHFGFASFRAGQREAIASVLAGRPTLVVMPTGSGKSLCFQLPALLLPGVTVVVSPLVALMKDQVDALRARGISATFVNSTLSEGERRRRAEAMAQGAFKLVYLAPERFRSPRFVAVLGRTTVSLLAVDEAHCISQWGHDFRPDYARLGEVRGALRTPRVLALTATATPAVRRDICQALRFEDPLVLVGSFDRPNLSLTVERLASDAAKVERAAHLAQDGSGIVYTATRRSAEKLTAALLARGVPAQCYHAGLSEGARRAAQEAFMRTRGGVVVATNAFGMGVDKPDIRFVAHAEIPKSVEAFYQEIGRAGRDGRPARTALFFNHADVFRQMHLIECSHPSWMLVQDVWSYLQRVGEAPVRAVSDAVGAREIQVLATLRLLEQAGHVDREGGGPATGDLFDFPATGIQPRADRGSVRILQPHLTPAELKVDMQAVAARAQQELNLLRRMTDYAYARSCRRRFLLQYFGESAPPRCERCDVCAGLSPSRARPGGETRSPRRETLRETLALFSQGLSVEQVAETRGLNVETVRGHLAELILTRAGVDVSRVVAPERAAQILEAARTAPPLLTAIKRALPPDFLIGEIKVVLAARKAGVRLPKPSPKPEGPGSGSCGPEGRGAADASGCGPPARHPPDRQQ